MGRINSGVGVRISEAQRFIVEVLETHGVRRSPLASVVGVYEELGELSNAILRREGLKEWEVSAEVGYMLAEVFFELLKLARDLEVDLEEGFARAWEKWRKGKPLWKPFTKNAKVAWT